MKKYISPFLALASLFVIAACSTKFKIAAPYKNITIVYGLLDERDPVHYIRIEKAFLDQSKSALVLAQIADSNFYPSVNARIKRFDFSGNYIDSVILTKVDLDTVAGYQKEPGVFFTTPNYAYQFSNTLNPNYIYQIMVTNPVSGETDSAQAPIIDDANTGAFYVRVLDDPQLNLEGIDFSSTLSNRFVDFNGSYTPPATYNFQGQSSPAYVAQIIFRFLWSDSNAITKSVVPDSVDMNLGYQLVNGGTITYSVSNLSFYQALANGMGTAPANIYRLLNRAELFVYASTLDYNNYYQNSLTQGVGLTGNEIEPMLTNIQGANTLGLFTSKGYRSGFLTLTYITVDSLEASPYLTQAKIAGTVYH
jgi:hypothetical protein